MATVNINQVAYANNYAQIVRQKIGIYWAELSPESRLTWLNRAIKVTLEAFVLAVKGTPIIPPQKYEDFKRPIRADIDGDGQLDIAGWSHAPMQLYATYDKACKNTWNPVVVKQLLELLHDYYNVRDNGADL